MVKYVAISLSSLAATLVLYDIGARRTRLTRFLLGTCLEITLYPVLSSRTVLTALVLSDQDRVQDSAPQF